MEERDRVREGEGFFPLNLPPQDKDCLIFIHPLVAHWWKSLRKSIQYDNEQIVIHLALSPLDSDSYQRERLRQKPSLCTCAWVFVCVYVCVPFRLFHFSREVDVITKTSLLARSSCHVSVRKLRRCHTWLIHTTPVYFSKNLLYHIIYITYTIVLTKLTLRSSIIQPVDQHLGHRDIIQWCAMVLHECILWTALCHSLHGYFKMVPSITPSACDYQRKNPTGLRSSKVKCPTCGLIRSQLASNLETNLFTGEIL